MRPWRNETWLARTCLASLVLLLSLGLGLIPGRAPADKAQVLPAAGWNEANLKRIQAATPGGFAFAVLGDSRTNPKVFTAILQHISRDPEIAFVIHLGDLVNRGKMAEYQAFIKLVQEHLKVPLLAVIGNHELGKGVPDPYRNYLQIFGPAYYAFQIGEVYFIVLDTAKPKDFGAPQLRWLEQELQKAQGARLRLVFLHYPLSDPRSRGKPHGLPEATGRVLEDLFKKYKVDHIFAAHIHGYFTGKWNGVPFTLTGGAGARLSGADPRHYFFHYLKVMVKGSQLKIQVERLPAPWLFQAIPGAP